MSIAAIGSVTATLAVHPGGRKLRRLKRGDVVTILGGASSWVAVEHQGLAGTVVRRVLAFEAPVPGLEAQPAANEGLEASRPPPSIPPEAQESDIRVSGNSVFGPGGTKLGTRFKLGLFQYGTTDLAAFFAQDPDAFAGLRPSVEKVMRAVSENEGKIEAINTWDAAHLSCGIYQWTAGVGGDAGELAHLLSAIKARSASSFEAYFGKYGLGVSMPSSSGTLPTGHLILNGAKLDTAAEKAVLHKHIWSYRFWRAAHDTQVRRSQVQIAIARIDAFYPAKIAALGNRTVSDFITSQHGVAQLLDQHVNRPGHVPKTLVSAIQQFVGASGKDNPATWTTADEGAVIRAYLSLRNNTNMTDTAKRADRIIAKVTAGELSDQRGSF